jgi:hypothetical protein
MQARQGKSFLMNLLAGEENLFKISNSKDPCTQGVDLSRKVLSWPVFHKMDVLDSGASRTVAHASSEKLPKVAFVDCEGQGTSLAHHSRQTSVSATCVMMRSARPFPFHNPREPPSG